MSEVTFAGAGVSNDTGIDITQGMIDNVANPFLDLDAIVTQFKFNDSSVTVKIPAGTTVKYGEDQCTLLEDVTATLTSDLLEDYHATTTSGTVLSGTTLDSGQLITTSGQWAVKLNSAVKVKTQDGYVILGTKDPTTLGNSDIDSSVVLSEGTNVYVANETGVSVEKVKEGKTQFYFLVELDENGESQYHQIVLQELYDTLYVMSKSSGLEYNDAMNKLLNLCLLAGTPASGQSQYTLATGVQRTVNPETGNYEYKIVGGGTVQAGDLEASFSKRDATARMALPYFALAIMYEKTCIQQMILVEQLKQIEKINDEIRENNKALKALTELYDRVYTVATWSANYDDIKAAFDKDDKTNSEYENLCYSIKLTQGEMSISALNNYLKATVDSKNGLGTPGTVADFNNVNADSYKVDGNEFITVVGRYDREGNNMLDKYNAVVNDEKDADEDFDSNTSNIDVKEQATLTHISNLQDQVRMYGDSLSTDAQLMTTKMEQYMQDANACVSACTQTVKSIGDYWKNIITNIR